MKKYYKIWRRTPNMVFFLVLGAVFAAVGVLGLFWADLLWLAVVCIAAGVLVAALPQFVLFERYGLRGNVLHYKRGGVLHKILVQEIGAAVICIYDEYRRGRGFVPVPFGAKDGEAHLPALVLLKSADENELDLCDTRTATCITFRKQRITDTFLDFDFLEELWKSEFSGKVYVSEYMAALFQPAFDELFGVSERVVVYDRLPKGLKDLKK